MLTQTKVPKGYHTITPYLTVDDAQKLLDFMRDVLEAEQIFRMDKEDGAVRHAEVRIGNSMVMIGQASGDWKARPGTLYLYVDDVDVVYRKALAHGAKSLQEPTNQSYGDRSCGFEDASGTWWWVATRVEDLTAEEMVARDKAQK